MYYKFEERNSCPQCSGALSHVGSVNTLDMFECIECGTRYDDETIERKIKESYSEILAE